MGQCISDENVIEQKKGEMFTDNVKKKRYIELGAVMKYPPLMVNSAAGDHHSVCVLTRSEMSSSSLGTYKSVWPSVHTFKRR